MNAKYCESLVRKQTENIIEIAKILDNRTPLSGSQKCLPALYVHFRIMLESLAVSAGCNIQDPWFDEIDDPLWKVQKVSLNDKLLENDSNAIKALRLISEDFHAFLAGGKHGKIETKGVDAGKASLQNSTRSDSGCGSEGRLHDCDTKGRKSNAGDAEPASGGDAVEGDEQ